MDSIVDILNLFDSKQVLIIGDAMIDSYMWGNVERMSPEAPVPIVNITKKESRLGGAANVALNIKSLGAEPILFSTIGDDQNGDLFLNLMKKENINCEGIQRIKNRATTIKTRIISENRHLLRVDEEETDDINDDTIIEKLENIILNHPINVIIFQDYNKGLLYKKLIEKGIDASKKMGIPTIVDPKKQNFFAYKGVTIFKPNLKEIKEGLKVDFEPNSEVELYKYVQLLRDKIKAKNILLTLSEHGMYIQNSQKKIHQKAHKRNIVDVSGAGDTVVSIAALSLACNLKNEVLVKIANLAGGLVCEKVGVVPIQKQDLLKASI